MTVTLLHVKLIIVWKASHACAFMLDPMPQYGAVQNSVTCSSIPTDTVAMKFFYALSCIRAIRKPSQKRRY